MILRSDEHKRIFFLTEKCASNSIREALLSKDDWHRIQSTSATEYGDVPDGYSRFAVVRNPFPRVLSYWAYRIKVSPVAPVTLRDFVLNGALDLKPLTEYLGGHRPLTHIIHFENLKEEWEDLHFGVDLPRLNVNEDKHHDYVATMYREAGDDVRSHVMMRYAADFNFWYAQGNDWIVRDG